MKNSLALACLSLFAVTVFAQNQTIKAGTALDLEVWVDGVSVAANAKPYTLVTYAINKISGERCQLMIDLTFPAPPNTKAPAPSSTFNPSQIYLVGVGNEIMCANNTRHKLKGLLICGGSTNVPASKVIVNRETGALISAKTGNCPNGKFVVGENVVIEGGGRNDGSRIDQ